MNIQYTITLLPILALLNGGCASTQPTQHLVDARDAYAEAASGQANQLVPAEVHDAKVSLEEAERAHARAPGSEKEKHLAYIAYRRAVLSMVLARGAEADRETVKASEEYDKRLLAQRDASREGFDVARKDLAQSQTALGRQELALASERQARSEAERIAASALETLSAVASIKSNDERVVITLSGEVLFKSDHADLLPLAKDRLDKVAAVLVQQSEGSRITVEGHTDSRGSDMHNATLSSERARSVRDYLIAQGVDATRIAAVGKGEDRPIASNTTPEGRANNRRVEIIIAPQT